MSEIVNATKTTDSNKQSIWAKLWERRVPQIIGSYLMTCWVLVQFVNWSANRYALSPNWVEFALAFFLLMLPSVVLVSFFHHKNHKGKLPKITRLGVPFNVLATVILLFLLFKNKDLGATHTTITVKNEQGEEVKRSIPKNEFRKRVLSFSFQNETGDASLDWLQIAIFYAIDYDLMQDMFVSNGTLYWFKEELKKAGFKISDKLPLAFKMDLANQSHNPYFFMGKYEIEEGNYKLTTYLRETKSGKLLEERIFSGENLWTLIDEISLQLRKDLGIPSGHIEEVKDLPISEILVDDLAVFQNYMLGVNKRELENDYIEGIKYMEQTIEAAPTFTMGHFQMAVLTCNNDQYEDCKEAMDNTIQHLYRLPERLQYLAKSIYYVVNRDLNKQLTLLEMWTNLYPTDIFAHQQLARAYVSKNNVDKAIEVYKKLSEIDKMQGDALLNAGDLLNKKGKYEEALNVYEQYNKQFPNDAKFYQRVGDLYKNQADYEQAKQYYEQSLTVDATNINVLCELGNLAVKQGYWGEGLKQYEAALKKAKTGLDKSVALSKIENYYHLLGQIDKAIEYGHQDLEAKSAFLNPVSVSINQIDIVELYLKAGKEKEAKEIIESLHFSDFFKDLESLAHLLYHLYKDDAKNARVALAKLDHFVEQWAFLEPHILYSKAKLAYLEGDFPSSITHYKHYLDKNASSVMGYRGLANSYSKNKQFEEAKVSLEEALKRHPSSPNTQYSYALMYLDKGETNRAKQHLQNALQIWKNADAHYIPYKDAKQKLMEIEAEEMKGIGYIMGGC